MSEKELFDLYISQLSDAGLSPTMTRILRQPMNEIIVNFHVTLPSTGETLTFKGYRVQHNNLEDLSKEDSGFIPLCIWTNVKPLPLG